MSSSSSSTLLSPQPPTFAAATNASSVSIFPFDDNLDVLKHVLMFVGENQYRFVAGVSRCFQQAYSDVFPASRKTYLNASMENIARFCWSEIDHGSVIYQKLLCRSAARHGNIQSLQYLRSVRCVWDEETCAKAALNGHLNVLQWCREHDCPWDKWTCHYAAMNGHLNVLKWCREHRCPWDEETYRRVVNRHPHIVQWCRENGCPMPEYYRYNFTATCLIRALFAQ